MSEDDMKKAADEAASEGVSPETAAAAEADGADYDPAADIARLEAEKADLTGRLVRLAADMDNLRKRTEREVADAHKYAVSRFAGDMLTVSDNLRRALEAVPADKRKSGDEALDALMQGVEMTGREMDRLLLKNGITQIAAMGERFDPHVHQAMFEVPDASVPAGTVVQVVQEGYQIGDRVLRAAMVGVSKAAPSAESATESQPDTAA